MKSYGSIVTWNGTRPTGGLPPTTTIYFFTRAIKVKNPKAPAATSRHIRRTKPRPGSRVFLCWGLVEYFQSLKR